MKKLQYLIGSLCFVALASGMTSCDDDEKAPSSISVFSSEFTAAETAGTITLGFQLDEPTSSDVTVTLSVAGGTATSGADFTLNETSAKIAAGETNGSFSITILNDLLDEADETIEVAISAPGLSSTSGTYKVTITDDDCAFEFVGSLSGVDANLDKAGFAGEGDVTITKDGDVYKISGLNRDFMENFWGEEIIDSEPITATIDGAGNITIEDQYIFTTLYDGDEYVYHIYGTGLVNTCDGNVTINYELDQDGFHVGAYVHSPGNWMTDDIFKAVLSPGE